MLLWKLGSTAVRFRPPPLMANLMLAFNKVHVFKEEHLKNGIYYIEKRQLNDRIFGNLLVKGGFYVTISGIDVEVTEEVFNKLKDGQEVCVVFPSVYYQKNGRPILLKEF